MTDDTRASAVAEAKTDERDREILAKSYELMVILGNDLRESEAKKELDTIKKWVEKNKGKVTVSDFLGRKRLAYRVAGNNEAWYAVFNFELGADRAPAMDKMLRLEKEVTRYLITILPGGYRYLNYAEVAEAAKDSAESKEDRVAEVVIEKKTRKKEEPPRMEERGAESDEGNEGEDQNPRQNDEVAKTTDQQSKDEPVDKDLDAKLDKILGGDLGF